MNIKSSGGLSNGSFSPKSSPGNISQTRPGAVANIKTTASVRHSAGSMAGSSGRSAKDIKSTAK